MGKCIIKLDGKFLHWSSVTDAPETPLLPEKLFAKYWKDEYGRSGVVDYVQMMELAKSKGTSSRFHTVTEILKGNRAGENDKPLSKQEIINTYTMTEYEDFDKWSQQRWSAFERMAMEFGPKGRQKRS